MTPPLRDTQTRPPGAFAIVVLFLVIITVPGFGLALGISRATVSESEMRELATWPKWSWAPQDMAAWPDAFQKYFEDHFALRNRLIDWRSSLLWNGLRTTSSDTVIAGEDNWLFYGDDGGINDWTQAEPFTHEELEVWREALVRRRAFLANRGIPFLFVIAPDKQMIYPEYMPESLRRMRDDFRADQLIAHMRQTTPDFTILDLRPAVVAAKPGELLYHRYDTHWNDRGGLAGYQAIARALRQWFPTLQPLQRNDFDTSPSVPSGDKTTLLGLTDSGKVAMPGLVLRRGDGYRVVEPDRPDPYGEVGRLVTEHRDRSLPKAVVFRDSFAGRLIPFLSEHFSRATYLWQNEFDFDEIEREKPDIVIQEFVARHFFTYLPYPGIIPN
jgi:hypothetical protein